MNKIEIYQLVEKNTKVPEYNIKYEVADEGEIYSLFYAHNGQWSNGTAGTLALTMIDDGNHVKFKPCLAKLVDYGDLERFRVLMSFQEKIKTGVKLEYGIFKETYINDI